MAVVIETTLGDITIDLFIKERPRASLNFLKLCKIKYFNYNLFHTISRGFIAQTGDPTGSRNGGESIFGVIEGPLKRYFEAERNPRIKHTTMGLVSFVGTDDHLIGSQFFITLGSELTYLDEQHCIFGEVMEGLDVLELLNEVICDQGNRPYQDVRITHTVILDDPFPDPEHLRIPSQSPSPSAERLQGGRIAPDEEIDETHGKSMDEVNEIVAAKEAKARATILEMIGDIPDAEMAPPENVLFVCKLNPVTTDDDLEIIFSRFGKINSCEVIRDKKTAESLQYAFVEFDDKKACEDAYFKMDNVLIDDRRIHVDFSQSVAKVKWHGKGRGVTTYDDKGKKSSDKKNDLGNGRYRRKPTEDESPVPHIFRKPYNKFHERPTKERYEPESNREFRRKDSYNKKDNLYEQSNRRYGRYEDKSSRNKTDYRYEEREKNKRDYYKSRTHSLERGKGNKERTTDSDRRNKHESKQYIHPKLNEDSKHLKYKKKHYSSSSGDSSSDSTTSSESSSEDEKRHRKRPKDTHKGKAAKKKTKKHSSSSSSSDEN